MDKKDKLKIAWEIAQLAVIFSMVLTVFVCALFVLSKVI